MSASESIGPQLSLFRGELAALAAAFIWSVSSLTYFFLGKRLPPLSLNFYKGAIAILLILLTLLWNRQPLPDLPPLPVGLLLLSGVVGIGWGDTAYFAALNQLGARRTLLLETLAPPIAAILASLFLAETLGAADWFGIILTVLGIAWVIAERTPGAVVRGSHPLRGILWAVSGAIAQGSGAVLSRSALVGSDLTPLWSTLLRLLAGTATVGAILPFSPSPQRSPTAWSLGLAGTIALTAFGSTYLGIWLQQTSLKFAPAGIAQTLLATSPLFVLPFAIALGERITVRAILGVLVALAGIGVLFLT